jgi:hypothetical protein
MIGDTEAGMARSHAITVDRRSKVRTDRSRGDATCIASPDAVVAPGSSDQG